MSNPLNSTALSQSERDNLMREIAAVEDEMERDEWPLKKQQQLRARRDRLFNRLHGVNR